MSETLRASEGEKSRRGDEADVSKRCLSKVPEIRRVGWVAFPPRRRLLLRLASSVSYSVVQLKLPIALVAFRRP